MDTKQFSNEILHIVKNGEIVLRTEFYYGESFSFPNNPSTVFFATVPLISRNINIEETKFSSNRLDRVFEFEIGSYAGKCFYIGCIFKGNNETGLVEYKFEVIEVR